MSSRFRSHPSSTFRQAVSALRSLLQEEGVDGARRAYAETTEQAIRDEYLGSHGLLGSHSHHVCVHRLKGQRCPNDLPHLNLPGADHLSEWKKERQTVLIVSQPYRLRYETLREIVAFCQANGLRADVETEAAWHFPGATVMVAYRREKKSRGERIR
jgi:hypothetical protein